MKFLKYLNKRGGRIVLTDIKNPDKKEWGTAEEAMTAALELERQVNKVSVYIFKLTKAYYYKKNFTEVHTNILIYSFSVVNYF